MLIWILLLIAIVIIVLFVKFTDFKSKFLWTFLIIFLLFIVITFIKVVSGSSIDLKTPTGVFSAVKLYFSWFGTVVGNIKIITGNIIRMEWFPSN